MVFAFTLKKKKFLEANLHLTTTRHCQLHFQTARFHFYTVFVLCVPERVCECVVKPTRDWKMCLHQKVKSLSYHTPGIPQAGAFGGAALCFQKPGPLLHLQVTLLSGPFIAGVPSRSEALPCFRRVLDASADFVSFD